MNEVKTDKLQLHNTVEFKSPSLDLHSGSFGSIYILED